MRLAIFGISNDGLNLAVNLFLLMLVAVYFASIAYTYMDARRRIEDPVLVACATVAALIPYVGVIVYMILRPPEFLEDARERTLETRAAELRIRQLSETACPNCNYPVEKSYLRCPNCQRRLKDPCQSCGKPVDPRWALCPYCETALPGRTRKPRQPAPEGRGKAPRSPREAKASGRRTIRRPRAEDPAAEAPAPEKRPARPAPPARKAPSRRSEAPPRAQEPSTPPPDSVDGDARTREQPARGRSER